MSSAKSTVDTNSTEVPKPDPGFGTMYRICPALLATAIVLALIPLVGLMIFAHPVIDDLYRAAASRNYGPLGAIRREYVYWTGRWSGIGAGHLVGYYMDILRVYPLILFAIALLSYLATCLLISVALGPPIQLGRRIFLATALWTLHWARAPMPGDTFFWMSGGLEYQGSLALAMMALGVALWAERRGSMGGIIAGCVLTIISCGMHELTAGTMIIVALSARLAAGWIKDGPRWTWTALLISAIAGSLIVVLAPGNGVRATNQSHSFPGALRLAWSQARETLPYWASDPLVLASSILCWLYLPGMVGEPIASRPVVQRLTMILPLAWLAVIAAWFFIPSWALNYTMPPRTLTAIHFIFLLGWFFTLLLLRTAVHPRQPPRRPKLVMVLVTVLASALLLDAANVRQAWSDLFSSAPAYDSEIRERYRRIIQAKSRGEVEVVVANIRAKPRSFFRADIGADPRHYRNIGTAWFYRVSAIRTVDPAGDDPGQPFNLVNALQAPDPLTYNKPAR